ncbi:winged helix DNA-binding protein [Gordonia sp. SID5947]|uniref:MarR family winged helix-turn-helix transcriptional regulator n=1 Tax=Gordonia sp. SID5947 TaxID=2690315 RepID=UPI00136B6BC1|nr:MarR family transcriptional regulator [Gordonia sp. SID5947]MYR08287.1 winged helix DNA-binding protein [Gordonia sp. SID5947]
MAGDELEMDLGAAAGALARAMVAAEKPILDEAGLSMWEYVVLDALVDATAISQTELSRRTRRDPTRLGHLLDELTERGLVERARSTDRRRVTVSMTPAGRRSHGGVKQRIRAMEESFLRSAVGDAGGSTARALLSRLGRAARDLGGPGSDV